MTSLFPPRESLLSDIPAGDGNIEKLFYGVASIIASSENMPLSWPIQPFLIISSVSNVGFYSASYCPKKLYVRQNSIV